ncbi:MAG: hypothetical protein AAF282_02175 [Cyanobacteria bacterium P01_A01_bin.15]
MSWEQLAEVSPGFDWETLPDVIEGYRSFKISHSWSPTYSYPGSGAAWICQVFPDGSRYGFRKLWPHRDPKIISLYAPADMTASNDDFYRLSIKRISRARIYGDANWRIRIWQWIGIPLDDSNFDPGDYQDGNALDLADDPLFDGGQYQL